MKHPAVSIIAKQYLPGLAVALLLIVGIGATFTASGLALAPQEGGPWLRTSSGGCAGRTVCAEWPDPSQNIMFTCCIDRGTVGTTNTAGCMVPINSRPLDGGPIPD